ncbi:MAG TPA: 3-hydroxyacyl-CoA dehydrogenase/enoyl-CoA hydratase family protein [Polyangia bacterium]|jgi:enoyl-CoA hydratase/3-hydroxyacyl-CoA dehydrogenase
MKVGVIGSGSIGPDLAYGFASALAGRGGTVLLHDIRPAALDAGVARIDGYLRKGLRAGKLTRRAADGVRAALRPTLALADLAGCDYVLEAATEELALKRRILAQVEEVVRPDCLIGFATSGLPRAQIAAEAKHSGRCFVNHPFFPAWRALPIEVVLSGDEALGARMLATLAELDKVPILTADAPCFAADDIFCNYISEAARLVAEGIATPAQVDRIVDGAIGGGGPFMVMDLTRGNLLTAHCQELMQAAPTGGAWFAPPPLLRTQGATPWHDPARPGDASHTPAQARVVLDRMLAVLLARTLFVVDAGICDASDLNWLTRNALGFSQGLLELAAGLGQGRVHELCHAYAAAHPGFPLPPTLARGDALPAFLRDVTVARDGDLAVVTIRRPEVKNALSGRTLAELEAAVRALGADPAVQGIVLTGWGGALAGADLGELAALRTPAECEAICHRGHATLAVIAALRTPIVAAVDGPVLGGGAELAMACHARVVGRGLTLGQPEVNLGIIPGYGGTQRLPRLIGLAPALELLRTGRTVDAAEACALGWASGTPVDDPVAAARELLRAARAGAARLTPVNPEPLSGSESLPPIALGHRSRAIDAILVDVVRRGVGLPLAEGLALEAAGFGRCKLTVDMDLGIKNFAQNGPRVPAAFLNE